ncbi:Ctr copper transporter family-domain-containing protein [Paraphoma chrysanthemicola]|uniref:Copper transport protein n=1 Tax=Paraphoma chrysanthemicola TaxID=798071 RepID=A0A8K0VY31_9PLEO|nr:Ctr copper transporter family-domain-containing protein [Paraphoma chrysanthemicola]
MDHSHMDHGHEGHTMPMPGMDKPHQCNMNMLFTWDTTDLCIVFRGWHVSGTGSLIVSLLAIVLLTAGYEAVREASRRYEAFASRVSEGRRGGDDLRDTPNESSSLLGPGRNVGKNSEQQMKIVKGALYAVQVFYSFFIMLLFMTYNGWVMLAVAVGAFVGYLLFSNSSSTKTVACH